jgi:GAF domain-containing protein
MSGAVDEQDGPVTRALLAAFEAAHDDRGLAEQVCRTCLSGLDVDGASLALHAVSAARETLWVSDSVAGLLDDLEFSLGEGVCMEAATTGRPVFVADVCAAADMRRWPVFADAVVERTPARALFALPLRWGAVNLGVLHLYRRTPGHLPAEQRRDVVAAVNTAALMMLGARTDPGDGPWLDPTVSNRAEVHQATGMVLAQLGIGATDALARMRAYAFSEKRLLLDVAHDIVTRRLQFTPDEP